MLVGCCGWVMILCQRLCGDLLEIGSFTKGVGCAGSQARRYLTARKPPWKQNGLPPIVNIMQIAHDFFNLTTRPHVWIQFLFTLPIFIFIASPTPLPPRFCLIFCSFFITELKLFQPMQLASMQPGQDPIFSFLHSLASIHFPLCFEYINPRFTKLCHQMLNLAVGSNFHLVHPCQT